MKRFFSSLSLRIWLPFALALILGMAGMTFYYSEEQGKQLRKDARVKMEQFSDLLALNLEASLDYRIQDMAGLQKTIEMAGQTDDFAYFALVQKDSATGREAIFSVFSQQKNLPPEQILNPDSSQLLYKKRPVKTSLIQGYLIIAASRQQMEDRIWELQQPLFYIMGVVLFLSLVVFFAFAQALARPVSYLTLVANQLTRGNYDVDIEERSKATEILDLNRALMQLRHALSDARKRNEDFNRNLEEEIRTRTQDLETTRLRLLEAQEVAVLGNYELDLQTGNWIASEITYSIFQIPADFDRSGNSWTSLFAERDLKMLQKLFERTLRNKTAFQKDICLQKDDDFRKERWISITGKAVSDPLNNRIQVIRGTIQDISERKAIENEVRRLSLVAEKTSNCVIITDVERRIIWVNESTIALTGYPKEDLIGKTPSIFQFEKTNPETKKEIHEKLIALKEVNVEILNRSRTGREYWVHLNIVALRNEENEHIGFMAVQNDVTERVQFEQELQEREQNFRNILENSSEMIHTLDREGKVLWANRSWREKLCLSGPVAEDMNLMQFLDEKTRDEFARVIPELNDGKTVTDLDCVFITLDGNPLILEGRAIPLMKDGKIIGSQAYLHDITKIRRAEHDLRQVLELTQRQNERLRNFTHIVSHNLRSHSSNLSGLIQLMNLENPDFQQNLLYINLEKAVGNLMDVIQNLGDVALIHTDDDKNLEAISLNKAIEKAIASVFGLAQKAGVNFHNAMKGEFLVLGDQGYLDSIILNLFTNAIKYRAEGRSPEVHISLSQSGEFVRLDVRDNGLGIDMARQGRKIFGMYKTFHEHPDARGVGLFLTKNQVDAMGGWIEVQSEVNKGSIFSVFLRRFSATLSGE